MERGWCLTLDSSDQVGFFGNKSFLGVNQSPRLDHHRSSTDLVMFPMNSRGREDDVAVSSPPEGERRVILGEVDFFAERKKPINAVVKKEKSLAEASELDVNTGLQLVTANAGSDQSTVDDGMSCDAEDKRAKNELAQLQAELDRMNAENQRLKGMLTQVSSNYSSLQMHLVTLMQQQQQNSRTDDTTHEHEIVEKKQEPIVPRQFLDLGSNQTADQQSNSISEERTLSGSPKHNNIELSRNNKRMGREESPESKSWAPHKAPRLSPPAKPVDQSAADATMRKARVSVRARSEAPMISDGCQWRKYGQKMAKGNPCPRAYYRCTMAVGCPVRKQVQRCADDRTILITTYEGNHNHPLPPAAMAMASTTSSAANMLLSGAMPSADSMMNPNFLARTILPYSSNMTTISASAPFPTVTLDLTQSPNPLQYQRPPPPQFYAPPQNFSAGVPSPAAGVYNQSKFSGLQMSSQEANDVAQFRGGQPSSSQQPQVAQPSFADTLSAATAAITADPNFTAALAAAISSIIGGSHQQGNTDDLPTPNNNNNNVNTSNRNGGNFPGN